VSESVANEVAPDHVGAAFEPAALSVRARPTWERPYAFVLLGIDGTGAAIAVVSAIVLEFRSLPWRRGEVSTGRVVVDLLFLLGWPAVLALSRAYETRVLSLGSEEFKYVTIAAVRMVAAIALIVFTFDIDMGRTYVFWVVAVALGWSLVGRYLARKQLHRRRSRGHYMRSVLAVGAPSHVDALVRHLGRVPYVGLDVVAAVTPEGRGEVGAVPVVGRPADVLAGIERSGADTVVIADSETLTGQQLHQLAWSLEGSGVDLLVAPAVVEVAGPRIAVRALGGLPLLYVEEPELTGAARLFKDVVDKLVSAFAMLLLSPVLIAIAIAVRATSPGPAFFRQARSGRDGRVFEMLKFRTMVDDAETQLDELRSHNEVDGARFKLRDDPRVTRLGGFLRRHSMDELPQLWNVLRGHMSLVGPRPPLPSEVRRYDDVAHRRLLVKPGMTGLWQVSGRAELEWDETVRLDLFYVENWSPLLDLQILWRTIPAVLRGRGAY
jgi:exopolysaccharide biosynthesis polyprenyl glycosylphosphotransferase